MNKTDEILERLKGRQPIIKDPEELTERIMSSLPDRKVSRHNKRNIGGRALLYITSAAAVLLVGLFLFLNRSKEQPVVTQQTEKHEEPQPKPANVEPKNLAQSKKNFDVSNQSTRRVESINSTRRNKNLATPNMKRQKQASVEEPQTSTKNLVLKDAADSLYYYLTQLENQMGDCRDSTCLAELTGLMRADERIKDLVNKIIHKQVETAYQEEYLVDTTTRYIPL